MNLIYQGCYNLRISSIYMFSVHTYFKCSEILITIHGKNKKLIYNLILGNCNRYHCSHNKLFFG